MTRQQAAAAADQQQNWIGQSWSNPVREGADTETKPWQTTCLSALHKASRLLHAGWMWLEGKRAQHVSSRRLRLTETISLGEKRSVSIIEVDGAQYLIGTSAGSVQLLTVLDKQDGAGSQRTEARAS